MKFKKVAVCMLLIFSLCCGSASAEEGDALTVPTFDNLTVITLDYVKNHPEKFSAYPDIIGQLGFSLKSFATAKEACRAAKPNSIHTDLMCPTCKLSDKLKYRYHFKQVLKDPTSTSHGVQSEYIFFSAYPARFDEGFDPCFINFSAFHSFQFTQQHDGTNFVYTSRTFLNNSTVFPSNIPISYTTNPNGGGDGIAIFNGTWLSTSPNSVYTNVLMPNHDGTYDPFVDFENNPVDIEGGDGVDGGDDGTYQYMEQMILEPYSKYTLERFRNAPAIVEKNDWVYDITSITKKNYPNLTRKLTDNPYFDSSISEAGNYHTYHLYLFNGKSWENKTVYSSRMLKFKRPTRNGDKISPPQLILQAKDEAFIFDYATSTFTNIVPLFDTNYKEFSEQPVFDKYFYLVNDDGSIMNSGNNLGSGTINDGGNITNTDGSDGGKPSVDDDGTLLDPNNPSFGDGELSGIVGFIVNFFKSISSFFDSLIVGIESLFSECSDFFDFLGGTFSFIPAEFWTLILAGMSILILLRIFGR